MTWRSFHAPENARVNGFQDDSRCDAIEETENSLAGVWVCLLSDNTTVIVAGFILQGLFAGGGMYGQVPSYLNERFPTEIRATATAFCYHQGAIFGGLVPPLLTYFAITWDLGFAIPMLVGTMFGLVNFILSLVFGPETKGTVMVPDLVVA